ncbi:MAG: hypothetical protein A3J69_00555 [Candidatus Levybacteria bacterium RIFCSPHIGHO2_02_FULL_42_12]|nr:MAG: hypothetical protein A2698_00275 [Candidatus Levybacteria bacterium RIFCSPHIGHO2_01_FULL_42_15]OGH30871.1 MAG: hypothetical protein A3J69_00555 [Candidatus Levybacteria bacterium RIFCSPHIGHO2_02_FULL_42_12]OGH42111.1 MAG: hypothetical protein A3B53_00865 [Candidatus Levybacteria bacterium RIFCSPLOWO2_01_FULL_42_15]
MKNPFLSTQKLLFWYFLYKDYLVFGSVVAICVLIFLIFVPAQVRNILLLNEQANDIKQKVKVLSANVDVLSGIDSVLLNNQLTLAHGALPSEKYFNGILQSVSQASSKAGVDVGDFTIEIGDLSLSNTEIQPLSSIAINITVNGDIEGVKRFLKELSHIFPLSEVISVQTGGLGGSRIEVLFYFKPYPLSTLPNTTSVKPLSEKERSSLNVLSSFQNSSASAF